MKIDIKSTDTRKIIDFRKAGFTDMVVLGKYNYTKTQKKLAEHVHKNMIEFCYLNKGSQWFFVNDSQYLVRGGDVFIHFPGEVHGSGDYPESNGLLYWLIIKYARTNGASNKKTDGINYLCNLLVKKNIRHFKATKQLQKLLEDIFIAYKKNKDKAIRRIHINLLVQSFLLELLACIDLGNSNTDNERLDKIIHYINQNITSTISIKTLAKEIYLSESRFKSLFKELTGFTPGDYIQRKRIEIAVERIKKEPQLSASDLAYQLNFSSPQYFSTVMKKYMGITPGDIRKSSL